MKKLLLALATVMPVAFGQPQTFTYSYSGLPIPIYPDDWDTVSVITLFVPRSMVISKVTVSVQVQYSGIGDINLYVWSAAGTRSKLLERNCGGLANIDTTFDDSAPAMFNNACPAPGSRPFRGNEPLANSNGQNAFGFWRLGIENNGSSKTGTLTGYSISITGTVTGPPAIGPNTVLSTASLEGGYVAPGDQVNLFGVNLGPTDGIRADATKNLPTSLGQTSVTFDGVAAPLYYVSDGVVQAQVPFGLALNSLTRIQVNTGSGSAAPVNLPVFQTKPGIFTHDAGGHGQARAINQDGSVNGDGSITSSDKPAAPGSVLQVYATGLGPVDPTIPQGTPAPQGTLSKLTLPISATIGGRTATVTWAGAAPGQVGMYQVNVMVPPLAASGTARLVLSVDGNNSQNGATVEIR